MIKRGELNPYWWYYPSLKTYLNMGTYTAVYLSGARSGRWQSVNEITVEDMLYWGRFVAVVFGTATVLLTFLLGRRLFGTPSWLDGRCFAGGLPSAVVQSQINKPDGMLAFMTTLSVLASVVYFQKGGAKLAVLNGLAIGLAMGTSTTAFWSRFRSGCRMAASRSATTRRPRFVRGVAGSIAAFFATNPFLITDFARS